MASVHPHACGEYRSPLTGRLISIGSSPRVWGILFQMFLALDSKRFIPTRVGNTYSIHDVGCCGLVHPHACGEYRSADECAHKVCGSSPRVWGILVIGLVHRGEGRFIPTRVGNTHRRVRAAGWAAVHPHACGEYIANIADLVRDPGSSPRVWGILWQAAGRCPASRFIPTRVGNTSAMDTTARWASVHPHACGEYRAKTCPVCGRAGSSPRVWGIRDVGAPIASFKRFIPTRVGNTPSPGARSRGYPVHPHACGEYTCPHVWPFRPGGSSPRVWGILLPLLGRAGAARFIPTRVGNTAS